MRVLGAMLVAALGMAAVAAPAEAQIYTWRDANGTLVLSDRPPEPGVETLEVRGAATPIRTTTPTRPLARLSRSGHYDAVIERYAASEGVRPDLVRAVIQVESAFNPNARSPVGAMGLMQLMPATAQALGVLNPYDPEQNIRGGVTYLRRLLSEYDGNEELALAAYNAGPGAVSRYGNQIPPYRETQDYVERVRSATALATTNELPAASGETIYKSYAVVNGRRIPVYSNVRPASDDHEVATAPRR